MASDGLTRCVCACIALVSLLAARGAAGQCTDGTQRRRDGGCGAPVAAPKLDPTRIAVLPFRTTGADPALAYLGNGLMELLSAQFNGAVGPEAVEPGEALRAWMQAGNARGVPTTADYLRVARALGAGQVAIGTIVGSPERFTLSTAIHDVGGGKIRVPAVKVEGSESDIASATTSLGTQVLGRTAGVAQGTPNEAIRAFLDGLAAYRARPFRIGLVQQHFLRATQLDSTFIQPAYRLVVANAIVGPANLGIQGYESSFRNLWKQRHTLLPEQRLLLEALADSNGLYFRMQSLPRLRNAISALPNSAEAWHVLASLYDYIGAAIGREDWAAQARRAALRAVELDESLCPNCGRRVLRDLAYLDSDIRAFTRYHRDETPDRYLLAILRRDAAAIRAARIDYARELSGHTVLPFWLVGGVPLPIQEADSLLSQVRSLANTEQQQRRVALWISMASHFAGRPARAREALRQNAGSDTAAFYLGTLLNYAYDDSISAERMAARLERATTDSSDARQLVRHRGGLCEVALSRLRRSDTSGVRAILEQLRPIDGGLSVLLADIRIGQVEKVCAQVARGVLASLEPTGGPHLHRADSMMRYVPLNGHDRYNYDLALAFAHRGEFAMAAAATRRHARNIAVWPQFRLVLSLRDGGRWALLAGDTASAIKYFKKYLVYRADPEPVLIPERDSVRTQLAALEKAYRPARRPTGLATAGRTRPLK